MMTMMMMMMIVLQRLGGVLLRSWSRVSGFRYFHEVFPKRNGYTPKNSHGT